MLDSALSFLTLLMGQRGMELGVADFPREISRLLRCDRELIPCRLTRDWQGRNNRGESIDRKLFSFVHSFRVLFLLTTPSQKNKQLVILEIQKSSLLLITVVGEG